MSEIKHKEWQTIKNLRDEIRQDMEDYKLLWTDVNAGRDEYRVWYLFLPQDTNNDDIELITNNLVQNLSSYEDFYNYYTTDFRPNNQYFANLHPYIEEILLILEANTHLQSIIDIKMLDNSISSKLTAFYKKAQTHLCKLKDWLEYSKTKDLKYYQQFGVPHSTTIEDIKSEIPTIDVIKDFNNYVDYDYVPKIKKLIEEARDLINILRSKHIA